MDKYGLGSRDYGLLKEMINSDDNNFTMTTPGHFFPKYFLTSDEKFRRINHMVKEGILAGDVGHQENGELDFRNICITEKGLKHLRKQFLMNRY